MIHQGIIRLEPLVTHTSTMDDHPALIQRLLDGDSSYIKGVVTLD
jgi:threonine dehydrogenase-like Zn-dependent dehydrogenase